MRILAIVLAGCGPGFERQELEPYPNPFGPDDPLWAAQPHRDNPLEVVTDGEHAWVSLQGSPDEPGRRVAIVDVGTGEVVGDVKVGAGATGLALHPDGELLVVTSRFANWISVVSTRTGRVVEEVEADFYATEAVFTPDGRELWITNRWRDAVQVWDVEPTRSSLGVSRRYEPGIPVGSNPRDLAVSADGSTVAVAALTGLTVSLIDTSTREERVRIDVGAPPSGVAFAGDWLVVPTLSRSTHHLPLAGPDGDGDGRPGDSTPNVNFQDLQNEIAVYRVSDGAEVWRYTSDTICCEDYRDVDPRDLARAGDLLPDPATWIVGGAVPEQVAVDGDDVFVTYSGSNQAQRFRIDPATGALTPGIVWETGHNPHGVAVAGDRVLIANRLGETLAITDRDGAPVDAGIVVGDVEAGAFPATDAELGELFNFVTAPFTVDGDQACAACHREGGNMDKALSMPLLAYPAMSSRMVMAYRGAADTRPWFFEAAMDQTNFRPVINEFARIENFCCSDPTLWPDGAPSDCAANPPPECASPGPTSLDGFGVSRAGPYLHERPTPHASRDSFFLAAAEDVMGRTSAFGDALAYEDVETGARTPLKLDFDGITRALGLFLLQEPALLPNPNDPESAAARRGRALFERADVACSTCHPAPTFATSTTNDPSALPLRMGPVVSPARDADGVNVDLYALGFVDTFPQAEMDLCEDVCGAACDEDPQVCDDLRDVRFGVPSLRGIWDRAPSMLHDGRARGLREVLCTPGHPALLPGETGFNETDGIPDTHGVTSQLTPREIDDLIAFLLTL